MRIGIPPDENLSDVHEFKSHIPVHSMNQTLLARAPGERIAGVPNTLPLQDLKRIAELGRVG
jgi:hypothetical protein